MKYNEFLRLAKKNGWSLIRQGKGSHQIWGKNEAIVVIPNHGAKEMPKGLERTLKKQMGI